MARNFVEYHIQEGAFHTFKVDAGETIRIGQLVSVTGDKAVSLAGAGDEAIGVVYSGTVGLDGLKDGYKGDNGDVVTVIVLKPLVYLQAGGAISAGANLKAGADGKAVALAGDGSDVALKVGKALAGASADERFLALLG
jgi:hypothetical protein